MWCTWILALAAASSPSCTGSELPPSGEKEALVVSEALWISNGADPELRAVNFSGNEIARVRWRPADRERSADVWQRYVEESLAGMARERDLTLYGRLYRQELAAADRAVLKTGQQRRLPSPISVHIRSRCGSSTTRELTGASSGT